MDELTVQNLNQLNTEFYTVVGESFSATRGDYWQGWDELLPFLSEPPQLKIVDFGCGNGRFLQFVSENIEKPIQYLGIDSSAVLLKLAEQSTEQLKNDCVASFSTGDLIQELSEGTLTLPSDTTVVTLFGVLHHIPSFLLRKKLFELLAAQMAAGSLLILSSWQFAAHERFQKKFLPCKITFVSYLIIVRPYVCRRAFNRTIPTIVDVLRFKRKTTPPIENNKFL